jgi:hypothetical protein
VVVDLLTGKDVDTEVGVVPVLLNAGYGIGYADGVATAYPAS